MTRDDAQRVLFAVLVQFNSEEREDLIAEAKALARHDDDRQRRTKTVEIPIDIARADAVAELDAHAIADRVEDLAVNGLRRAGVSEVEIQAHIGSKR
jgi:hypothetical protein